MQKPQKASFKSFVIYRRQMLQLLAYPKPAHDQLCIELPCLMGFRASEVTTWRAEYIDFDNGDTLVMDCKKNKLLQIPLNIQVAAHTEKVLNGRREGLVLRSRSNRNLGGRLTRVSIWYSWRRWAKRAKLLNWREFSPVVGRRFFAAEWFHHQRLSLLTLSMVMRHVEPRVTLGYVQRLIFYEDLRRDFKQFQLAFLHEDAKSVEDEKQVVKAWPTHGW